MGLPSQIMEKKSVLYQNYDDIRTNDGNDLTGRIRNDLTGRICNDLTESRSRSEIVIENQASWNKNPVIKTPFLT